MSQQTRQVTELIITNTIDDTEKCISIRQNEVKKWQQFWKNKQENYFEKKFDADSLAVKEVVEIRKFLNQFLTKKLSQVKQMEEDEKRDALRLMIPFNSDGGIKGFLLHFFQLKIKEKELEFEERDPYSKEAHLLYDIYRIKKTIECVDAMRKTLGNPHKQFNSTFSEEKKKKILEDLRSVLFVLIKYTIKPEHRKELLQNINPSYMSGKSVFERRNESFLYCYPHVIEKYDYRNLFFLMYFEKGLATKISGKSEKYRYNYTRFEVLKQEYLTHWMKNRLKNNPVKKQIYDACKIDGKSMSSWIEEDEEKEAPLLKKMSTNTFNTLSAEVNECVDEKNKAGMPTLSETKGELFDFQNQLEKVKKFFKSPLKNLASFLESDKNKKIKKQKIITKPALPKIETKSELQTKITLLNQKQIPYFYLWEATTEYKNKLNIIRVKMGDDYQKLRKLFSKFNKKYREKSFVIRRTPKFDWTLPFLVQYIKGEQSTNYLLILGAEASVKYKGMGYSTGKDEFSFVPYFVFAANLPEECFGDSVGVRSVRGKAFQEYDVRNETVRKKALELMELIEKDKLK